MADSPPKTGTTFIDKRLAESPYKMLLPAHDGSEPMLVFSFRPLEQGMTDMLRAAIRGCKPVPTVLTSLAPTP